MNASSSHALAIGIAVGGACVGMGIFFGLRAHQAPALAGAPTSSAEPQASPSSETVTVDAARAELARQLEAARPALRDKCWAPAAAQKPAPDHSTYSVDVTFDASGKRLALGVNPASRADRAEIAFCLTSAMPALAIAPQGATVHVVSRLTLP